MHVVITGADGFIGKNLRVRLTELGHTDVAGITRSTGGTAVGGRNETTLEALLAGVNYLGLSCCLNEEWLPTVVDGGERSRCYITSTPPGGEQTAISPSLS